MVLLMNNNEFEKNRLEILKKAELNKSQRVKGSNKEKIWKYEILKYRKQKKKELFFMIGSIAGILSLVLTIALNYYTIIEVINGIFK